VDVSRGALVSVRLAGPVADLSLEVPTAMPWSSPSMVLLGFVALVGLVIVLGRSSTARYEGDRYAFAQNSAHAQRERAAVAASAAAIEAGEGAGGTRPSAGAPPRPLPASAAAHPAGRSLPAARPATWWLVDEAAEDPASAVVAGPFGDAIDAEWSALATGLAAGVRPEYGVLRADGSLSRRDPGSDRAWLVALGLQLARLPEDWDAFLSDTDELGTLVVEVGAALLEAGLPLYDCAAFDPEDSDPSGGVCLVPDPASGGILASWRSHDRLAVDQVRGTAVAAAVQQAMTVALGDVLTRLGFCVRPLPSGAGHLVTDERC
jgi:hypothetical protein